MSFHFYFLIPHKLTRVNIAQIPTIKKAKVDEEQQLKHEFEPPRHPERLVNRHDLDSGLGRLLLQRNTLVIERKISFIRICLIY